MSTSKERRVKRQEMRNARKTIEQKGHIMQSQMLRYDKTILWCEGKTAEEIMEMVKLKKLDNYPAKAKDLAETEEMLKTGVGLQSTGLSNTDMNAIGNVFKYRKQLNEKNKDHE